MFINCGPLARRRLASQLSPMHFESSAVRTDAFGKPRHRYRQKTAGYSRVVFTSEFHLLSILP
ncbi:Hypothetical protein SMAX5B_000221 [Scophthalmus maximus]|uniref:Uncharacterized protein n=1 Tax=Scophthalmus maximus TaxID=52904 RepID=A0A2U9CUT6_SCOMX|nr:Hypothetical protein SMAX5B_000221 [Scophthalmus maximus]